MINGESRQKLRKIGENVDPEGKQAKPADAKHLRAQLFSCFLQI